MRKKRVPIGDVPTGPNWKAICRLTKKEWNASSPLFATRLSAIYWMYFPSPIREPFKAQINSHPLRREIGATMITNSLVNRVGGTFLLDVAAKTESPIIDIARAYIVARDVFGVRTIWQEIEALDHQVPSSAQILLIGDVQHLLERSTIWFLRNGGKPIDLRHNVSSYKDAVTALGGVIDKLVSEQMRDSLRAQQALYESIGVPEALARRTASLAVMSSACDIVRVAGAHDLALEDAARVYFALGEYLRIDWVRAKAEMLLTASHWQKLAVSSTLEELDAHQSLLTGAALDLRKDAADDVVETWANAARSDVDSVLSMFGEMDTAESLDVSMLTVATRRLGTLAAC